MQEAHPPQKRKLLRTVGPLAAVCAIGLVACAGTDDNQVMAPVVLGMTSTVAPIYDDGENRIYEVQLPVELPVRQPNDAERNGLGDAPPYPRAPFFLASDERVEMSFTLSNLDDQPHVFELLLDPWNEFVRYHPGIVVTEEEAFPNFSGYQRHFAIPAKGRVSGTITSDDTLELAIDLGTVQNIISTAPPPDPDNPDAGPLGLINRTFNLQNRSNTDDKLVRPHIPAVIPGLTGFDLGLRAPEPMNIAVEIVLDVTDVNGNRMIPAGKTGEKMGIPPEVLTPPGAQ